MQLLEKARQLCAQVSQQSSETSFLTGFVKQMELAALTKPVMQRAHMQNTAAAQHAFSTEGTRAGSVSSQQ